MALIPRESRTPRTLTPKSHRQVLLLVRVRTVSGVVSSTMMAMSMLVCLLSLASTPEFLTCSMDRLGMVFQARERMVNNWRCFSPSSCIVHGHSLHTTTPYCLACTLLNTVCFKGCVWLLPITIFLLTLTRNREGLQFRVYRIATCWQASPTNPCERVHCRGPHGTWYFVTVKNLALRPGPAPPSRRLLFVMLPALPLRRHGSTAFQPAYDHTSI